MHGWPDDIALRGLHARMRSAAERLRLPFRSRAWRGQAGNWLGAGIGSSIDFQDHRPYLPGDDPRYIDWQAYARTGAYTMKLYREEVSPRVDVALDVSESMLFEESKQRRALELFYFSIESALQSGASLRCYFVAGKSAQFVPVEAALGRRLPQLAPEEGAPATARVPWRQGAMRVFISDLLFPGSPQAMLTALSAAKGRGLIFAPFCSAEAAPDWDGNVEMTDCESGARRVQHVDGGLRRRYLDTYARHFELWKEHSRKHAALIARVAAEAPFEQAMQTEALRAGAVELVSA
jgi:uncharacterized protein (DUF58 family)